MVYLCFLSQNSFHSREIYGIMTEAITTSMRNKAASFDCDGIKNNEINIYANNMNTTVSAIANECIQNRCIKIKPSEPPWITSDIKTQAHNTITYRSFKHFNENELFKGIIFG